MHRALRVLLVLLCGVLAACGSPPVPRHLLVVVVDALRADHLGCYGYARPTSPRLDALAAGGTRFANAVSHSPWTLPSMATLWTGLYPSVHDAVRPSDGMAWATNRETFRPVNVLADSHTTLAEILRDEGFATAAFTNGAYAGAVFGFGQGFQRFSDDALPGVRFNVEALLAWLDAEKPRRFFAYLHPMHVHSPYAAPNGSVPKDLPEPDAARMRAALAEEQTRWAAVDFDPGYAGPANGSFLYLQGLRRHGPPPARDLQHVVALYDRGIVYTDGWIGHLLDGLDARGLLRDTLVVVTADHGEEFFEHGGIEHTRTHYEELSRVPLLLHGPGIPRGTVVEPPVGLVDVLPTVLDLLDVAWDGTVQGRSVVPLLRGEALEDRPLFLEGSQSSGLEGVRLGPSKYLRAGLLQEELYDLGTDPGERVDLCVGRGEACAPFRRLMDEHVDAQQAERTRRGLPAPARAVVDRALRDRLRELGYAQ